MLLFILVSRYSVPFLEVELHYFSKGCKPQQDFVLLRGAISLETVIDVSSFSTSREKVLKMSLLSL